MSSKMSTILRIGDFIELNKENIERIKNMKSTIRFPAQINHSVDSIFYHNDTGFYLSILSIYLVTSIYLYKSRIYINLIYLLYIYIYSMGYYS